MEYYLAVDNNPKGPYTADELRAMHVSPDDLVWKRGMSAWTRIGDISDLNDAIFNDGAAPAVPPRFDRGRFDAVSPRQPEPSLSAERFNTYYDETECPRSYMWVAIISFIGIIPLAIVAVIKASMVKRLWSEGKQEEAEAQSRSVLKWAIPNIIVGVVLTAYVYLHPTLYTDMVESVVEMLL